jgi:glycosyltransferase involved in cell wall biosynthesis
MKINKKVLYISYDGMTDPLGQSQVLPYLTELSKQGYAITILSFEKRQRYAAERKIIEKIVSNASITWMPLFFTSKPPVFSKMYDRWQMLRKASWLYKQEKFDIVHCRSYIAAEAGLRLKKRFRVKFLFDMRGFWADEKVDCGQWDQKKIIFRKVYRHYKKMEKQFLLNADAIVSLTQAAKDIMLGMPAYKDLSIQVIPCCADLEHFDFNKISEQETASLKKELGIPGNKKIITYLGSLGGWYMTDEMFSFYKQLLLKEPELLVLLLTKDDPSKVWAEVEARGIKRESVFIRYANRNEVPRFLSLSDYSIFFIRPTFSKTASSPTKHAELMSMGIPVICNDIGDTGRIIKESGTGVVVKDFSEEAYDQAIRELLTTAILSRSAIRKAAFEYFDLKKGSANYAKLYERILNQPAAK